MKIQTNEPQPIYYAGVTKEFIIDALMESWALQTPENYFHNYAYAYLPSVKNNPLKKELAVEIVKLPQFQEFIQKLFKKCVTGDERCGCALDNEDVYKFAKIAIKNISDYEYKRNKVRETVEQFIKQEKSKVTQKEIQQSKKILKLAGFKITK
jgi:predicted metal-binding transcription factor (methanogenesis marker protein 9)